MNFESLTPFWPLLHSVIQEFLAVTEPHIEDAAIRLNIPIVLYYYGELGLDHFSIAEFQKRDPFTNPVLFERAFVTLNFKGWIEPMPENRYLVTERARKSARQIIQAGDTHLLPFESFTDVDLERFANLLKQVVLSNRFAAPPPEKWATVKRFSVLDRDSPAIVRIREYLMNILAYRDDAHISASHPHFGQAGIVWSVLGSVWQGDASSAEKMAEILSFRGYEVDNYEVALQAAVQIGWVEETATPGEFRPTQQGRELRAQVEQLTNQYFYAPWSAVPQGDLDELYDLLLKMREQLHSFRKVK